MRKKSIISGMIAGGLLVGFFLITHLLFMKNLNAKTWGIFEVVGYSSIIIALTAIFFGVKGYRDKVLGGKISFGKAFTLGLGISGVASIIFGIYVYILYTVISPDLTDKMIECYRERVKTSGETQQVITQELAQFETEEAMWRNPFLQSFAMLVTILAIGILISLISAAILRRREPIPID